MKIDKFSSSYFTAHPIYKIFFKKGKSPEMLSGIDFKYLVHYFFQPITKINLVLCVA
ncbi:MAG: hypothetical protein JSR09_05305 [Bacteroidetes bacterium]|nr:hypothetical protein [Bacteroidota bacterium]MBS1649104.1 hypothetical protein [Bacteroidota bacterium]